ncbi:hypothetical protein CTAYLR_006759 [Chrysophaeum taylorii]|uniref:Uncharacterized protein n=1 Tax=Chrysophaeum taylorii TaxID=2483200 RepID=A0AAD7UBZ5_9STRA|nr:hypothetical protein CTAYLR_006759 [Chrysophaeum taylorii]
MSTVAKLLARAEPGSVVVHRPFAGCDEPEAQRWARRLAVEDGVVCAASSFGEGEWRVGCEVAWSAAPRSTGLSWRGAALYEIEAVADADDGSLARLEVALEVATKVRWRVEVSDGNMVGGLVQPLELAGLACGVEEFFVFLDALLGVDDKPVSAARGVALVATRPDKPEVVARVPATLKPTPGLVARLIERVSPGPVREARSWRFAAAAAAGLWERAPKIDVSGTKVKVEAGAATWTPGHRADVIDAWTAALEVGADVLPVDDDDDDVPPEAPLLVSGRSALSDRGLGKLLRGRAPVRADVVSPDWTTCRDIMAALRDGRLDVVISEAPPPPALCRTLAKRAGVAVVQSRAFFGVCDEIFAVLDAGGAAFLAVGTTRDEDDEPAPPFLLLPLEKTHDAPKPQNKGMMMTRDDRLRRVRAGAPVGNPLAADQRGEGGVPVVSVVAIPELQPTERLFLDAMRGADAAAKFWASAETTIEQRGTAVEEEEKGASVAAALDSAQRRFVAAATSSSSSSVTCVSGGPGSGRTRALAHAVSSRLCSRGATAALVVAPCRETLVQIAATLADAGLPRTAAVILSESECDDAETLSLVAANVNAARLRSSDDLQPREEAAAIIVSCSTTTPRQEALHATEEAVEAARSRARSRLERVEASRDATRKATIDALARTAAFVSLRAYSARGERPGGRKHLASAFAALDGWSDLLRASCPVVLATPRALPRWLALRPAFDVLAVDDAAALDVYEIVPAIARLQVRAVCFVAGTDDDDAGRHSAWSAAERVAEANVVLRERYGGDALPFAASLDHLFKQQQQQQQRLTVRKGRWPSTRVDSTLGGVASALARCRGEREFPSDAMSRTCYGGRRDVAEDFRALRGATVCIGAMAAAVETLRAVSKEIRLQLTSTLSVVAACSDSANARCLRVLLAAEDPDGDVAKAMGRVYACDFKTLAVSGGVGACDVALVCSAGGRRATTAAPKKEKALRRTIRGARLAAIVLASGDSSDDFASVPPATEPPPPPPWAVALVERARELRDMPMRLVPVRHLYAVANYDSLVLCHPKQRETDESLLTDVAVALPAALRRFAWRRVLHLCEPPESADAEALAAALVSDLCSWRRCVDFESVAIENSNKLVGTVRVSGPVPARVLGALRVRARIELPPWIRRRFRKRPKPTRVVELRKISATTTTTTTHHDNFPFAVSFVAEGHKTLAAPGTTCVFELCDGTSVVLASASAVREATPPLPPNVVKIEVASSSLSVFIRAYGARASPWNDQHLEIHCVATTTTTSGAASVAATRRCCCSPAIDDDDDDPKLVSLVLELDGGDDEYCVSVWAENSAGSSEKKIIADGVVLPPRETPPEDRDRVVLETEEDGIDGGGGAFCDEDDNDSGPCCCCFDDEPADVLDGCFAAAADEELQDDDDKIGGRLWLSSTEDEGTVNFHGVVEPDATLEIEARRWRTDAPEEQGHRFSVLGSDLETTSDGSRCLGGDLRHKFKAPPGSIAIQVRARLLGGDDDWTSPVLLRLDAPSSLIREKCPRVVDAWLDDSKKHHPRGGNPTQTLLAGLQRGCTLHISIRLDFYDDDSAADYWSANDASSFVSANIVLSSSDERLPCAVSSGRASSNKSVVHLKLAASSEARRVWYRCAAAAAAAEQLVVAKAVRVSTARDDVFELGASEFLEALEDPPATNPLHVIAVASTTLFDGDFETVADVATVASEIGRICLCAERAAMESTVVDTCDDVERELARALVEEWEQQQTTPPSAPFGSASAAAQDVLRAAAAACSEARQKTAFTYVEWLMRHELAPETRTASLEDVFADVSDGLPALGSLLIDATRDEEWSPAKDKWVSWLALKTDPIVVDALASALLSRGQIALVPGRGNKCELSGLHAFRVGETLDEFDGSQQAAVCFFENDNVVDVIVPVRASKCCGDSLLVERDGAAFVNPASRSNTAAPVRSRVEVFLANGELWSTSLETLRLHEHRLRVSSAYAAIFGSCSNNNKQRPLVIDARDQHMPPIAGVADATQRKAIARVVAGESFVMRGPPGTGKSATISNAAVALAATGKTVLIIGQEEAAARVVAHKIRALSKMSTSSRDTVLCAAAEDILATKPKVRSASDADGDEAVQLQYGLDYLADEWRRLRDHARLPSRSFAASHISLPDDADPSSSRWSLSEDSYRPGALAARAWAEEKTGGWKTPRSARATQNDIDEEDPRDEALSEDLCVAVLHRGRMRDGTPREWRYVCELCGERRASAATARRHLAKHKIALAIDGPDTIESQKKKRRVTKREADARDEMVARYNELQAWQDSDAQAAAATAFGERVVNASAKRVDAAAADLAAHEGNLQDALERLTRLNGAMRRSPVAAAEPTLQAVAAHCLKAALLHAGPADGFFADVAVPFAEALHNNDNDLEHSRLFALVRLLASSNDDDTTDASSLGVAAALASLERIRCSLSLSAEARATADALYDARSPSARSSLADLVRCAVEMTYLLSNNTRSSVLLTDGFSASKQLARSARCRSLASLRVACTRADAAVLARLHDAGEDSSSSLKRKKKDRFGLAPIVCATPASARRLGLLDRAGVFDVVFIDEASQMRTRDAVPLAAAARTSLVIAGDDQQLPPRASRSNNCSASRGVLDDVLDLGILPLVPLEWHYRSGDPTLIAISNALFYDSRLVAPFAAPRVSQATDHTRKGLMAVLVGGDMESDRGPPAGLVNYSQAAAVAKDARDIIAAADSSGESLSLGIITLNRPQRSLIAKLLLADNRARLEPHPTYVGALRRRPDVEDRAASVLERDAPLFVESIDRIQGEERDVILFSTLLAPRNGGPVQASTRKKQRTKDETTAEPWDALEEISSSSDDEEGGERRRKATTTTSNRRAQHRSRASAIRHYSTLTHAHGHRLLNVGITRAIRTMRCYVHPECPAPSPHDDRRGRRAFGWLVRALLGRASPCSCASCAHLAGQLAHLCQGRRREATTAASPRCMGKENVSPGGDIKPSAMQLVVRREDGEEDEEEDLEAASVQPGPRGDLFAQSTVEWLEREARESAACRVVSLAPTRQSSQTGAVDAAAFDARGRAVAVLCSPSPADQQEILDAADAFPNALLHPKLGWTRVCRLEPSSVISWIVEADDVVEAFERVAAGAQAFARSVFFGADTTSSSSEKKCSDESASALEWFLIALDPHRIHPTETEIDVPTDEDSVGSLEDFIHDEASSLAEDDARSLGSLRSPHPAVRRLDSDMGDPEEEEGSVPEFPAAMRESIPTTARRRRRRRVLIEDDEEDDPHSRAEEEIEEEGKHEPVPTTTTTTTPSRHVAIEEGEKKGAGETIEDEEEVRTPTTKSQVPMTTTTTTIRRRRVVIEADY